MNPDQRETVRLDAIEARLKAATPGKWRYRPQEFDDWGVVRGPADAEGFAPYVARAYSGRYDTEKELDEHRRNRTDPCGANAQLIAHAGGDDGDIAFLLAEVRRLREADRARDEALRRVTVTDEMVERAMKEWSKAFDEGASLTPAQLMHKSLTAALSPEAT